MSIELGHFALILATAVAVGQAVVGFMFWRNGGRATTYVRYAAILQFLLVAAAFAALVQAFVVSDFSVALVRNYSHTLQPLIFKITSVWANHEGSLLLWVLILTIFGAAVAVFGRKLPDDLLALILGVQGALGAAFAGFTIFTSNPFLRLYPVPFQGKDVNPILQDLGIAIHPPLLYLGYVGLSICFSFAIAALISGRIDAAWAKWVRPWALASWVFLTLGIAMGSYWAYYELGWGGWWFWDPVENASLMPWLATTALLHSALVMEKRNALKVWTIFLAILSFSLSLLGMFLVRSGILTSVHSFASDPVRGIVVLAILGVVVGGAFVLFAARAGSLRTGGLFAPISREGSLIANNLFLSTAVVAVLVGTLYPLILQAINGTLISVGAPFFDLTFGILMAPLLILLPIGPFMAWKRSDIASLVHRLAFAAGLTFLVSVVVVVIKGDQISLASFGLLLGFWIVIASIAELADRVRIGRIAISQSWRRLVGLPKNAWSTTLAHMGVGITLLGIVSVSAWQTERVDSLNVGDSVELSGYKVVALAIKDVAGSNYAAREVVFEVTSPSGGVRQVNSQKRIYTANSAPTTEAGILTYGFSQVYISLGDFAPSGSFVVRVWYKPFIILIWLGTLFMAGAGFLSLSDRKLRVGVPKSARPKRPVSSVAEPAQ
ncbi:Cytochrome c heme lyase subunit CcmF [hydrothermal vent metagenome]|uniref:Cytochrome c heme lyase subunit CcmF n=1 Tax=hydrothermal vent metagenome TaxID=652676 RepID=A0A3B0TTL5_9ZZZZ